MKNTNSILIVFLLFSTVVLAQNRDEIQEEALDTIGEKTRVLDSITFSKTADMLDEEMYWSIIERSKKGTDNIEDQELFLISELEKLTPKEMVGFRLRTDQLLFDTYTSPLWCAAYIMNGGASNDGFDYFRCWIISRGKDVFYAAKSNPDSLLKEVKKEQKMYEFESFWYVAMSAFTNVTGKDLYSYIDYENFVTNDEHYPLLTFDWNIDDPKTMGVICPDLYKNLWK